MDQRAHSMVVEEGWSLQLCCRMIVALVTAGSECAQQDTRLSRTDKHPGTLTKPPLFLCLPELCQLDPFFLDILWHKHQNEDRDKTEKDYALHLILILSNGLWKGEIKAWFDDINLRLLSVMQCWLLVHYTSSSCSSVLLWLRFHSKYSAQKLNDGMKWMTLHWLNAYLIIG